MSSNQGALPEHAIFRWSLLGADLDFLTDELANNYPYFNEISYGKDTFALEFAVAGFSKDELSVNIEENVLTISGKKNKVDTEDSKGITYHRRGIATRAFRKKFNLDSYIEVSSVLLKDGILTINLVRNVPEEKKKRMIQIKDESS